MVFYFQGPYGVGKQSAAEALCRELGRRLLVVDGERLINAEELAFETAVRLILREALLQDAVLYWDGFDSLLADERLAWRIVLLRGSGRAAGTDDPGRKQPLGAGGCLPGATLRARRIPAAGLPRTVEPVAGYRWTAPRLRMARPTCRRWPASSASAAARSAMRRPQPATWPAGATRTAAV